MHLSLTPLSPPPPVYTVPDVQLTVPITAEELSVARVTDTMGNPQAKASAALSRPYLLFKIKDIESTFTKEQLEAASWQVTLTGSNGLDIKIGAPTPVTSRIEFACPVHDYTVTPTVYLTFKDGSNQTKVAKLTVASPLSIAGQAEFSQKKYINLNDNSLSDSPKPGYTELTLDTADDFNYHFNGLNYPNYAAYKAARASGSSDKEAQALYRLWEPEADPNAPTVRHSASWDIRGCETKNSTLLIKTLQRDNDSIFLAKDGEKKYGGFTDLYSGPSAGDSTAGGSHKMINGSICSEKHSKQYGYFEAKVRVKNLQQGHWAAFWVYGDHYEYDIMEFGQKTSPYFDQTTHWHNGWSKPKYRDSLHGWSKPSTGNHASNGTDTFFTLGLYWDEVRFVYYVNGIKTHEVTRDSSDPLKATYKRYETSTTGVVGNKTTDVLTVMQQPRDEGGTGGQSISDDFMRTYFSNEVLYSGWMGNLGIGNEGKMPSWMEVEYYAYYKR